MVLACALGSLCVTRAGKPEQGHCPGSGAGWASSTGKGGARLWECRDMSQARPFQPPVPGLLGRRWGAAGPHLTAPTPRVKDPMAAGDDSGHIRFFSFSLIEGYISLVMDVQTQQR